MYTLILCQRLSPVRAGFDESGHAFPLCNNRGVHVLRCIVVVLVCREDGLSGCKDDLRKNQ